MEWAYKVALPVLVREVGAIDMTEIKACTPKGKLKLTITKKYYSN
jgi:hypothetical protein